MKMEMGMEMQRNVFLFSLQTGIEPGIYIYLLFIGSESHTELFPLC